MLSIKIKTSDINNNVLRMARDIYAIAYSIKSEEFKNHKSRVGNKGKSVAWYEVSDHELPFEDPPLKSIFIKTALKQPSRNYSVKTVINTDLGHEELARAIREFADNIFELENDQIAHGMDLGTSKATYNFMQELDIDSRGDFIQSVKIEECVTNVA